MQLKDMQTNKHFSLQKVIFNVSVALEESEWSSVEGTFLSVMSVFDIIEN